MKSKWSSTLQLIVASSLLSLTHSYIIQPECQQYINDIRKALQDYENSISGGQAALAPQEGMYPYGGIIDWTGLLTPLFHGLTYSHDYTLRDTLEAVSSFDQTLYSDIDEAIESASDPVTGNAPSFLPFERRYLDSTTRFICDPSTFSKDVAIEYKDGILADIRHIWYDSSTDEVYEDLTLDDGLCPPGVPTRLAHHTGQRLQQADDEEDPPPYYIVVLCPEILTQTPGKPKNWATVDGQELTNTRPSDGSPLNELAYVGMSIDELGDKVLSVHLMRNLIIIVGQKWGHDILPRDGYDTYARCATLDLEDAKRNANSLVIFITGARLYYNTLNPQAFPAFLHDFRTLAIPRWKEGILESPSNPLAAIDSGINY